MAKKSVNRRSFLATGAAAGAAMALPAKSYANV
ncbi:MAG: twin-arginine translocation signal domain-containing protein, partial [Gemmataceae bacterium]|nr:twin-arginine translocation signal domain-containing protein [Gemmataceae bacterium]